MVEITHSEYKDFLKIGERLRIKSVEPEKFELEGTNVWSFPRCGSWATHKGNWTPQMARNLILRYSKVGERVLDQMVGSGTTLVECKLLGREGIGVDINLTCIMLTRDRLNFRYVTLDFDSNRFEGLSRRPILEMQGSLTYRS